jgi:S1-C subfamily serine protease
MLLSTDEQFKSLVQGNAQAVPQLVLTQGIVTVVQEGGSVPLVVHSAQVSPGSSGGPLVDLCGRVLGLNTFVTSDRTAAHVNYALSANDLGQFLQQSGVTPVTQDGTCQPQQVAATGAATP